MEVGAVEAVAILIPTRNRPIAIGCLLESISKSTLKPEQVIVVSSGQDIGSVINKHSKALPITHSHTDAIGQIAQKRIGVGLIAQNITWCVFLDDDLLLEGSALEIAMSIVNSYTGTKVIGIGLSTPVTSRGVNLPVHLEILARLFKLSSNMPGKVLSSGHASSYLQSDSTIETQWLNGASMWRAEDARSYGLNLPSTPYAACEDLIFSFPLSKKGTLLFTPEPKVFYQDTELSQFDSFRVIEAASLWRFYFVSMHKELSLGYFFLSQLMRSIYAMIYSKDAKSTLLLELIKLNWAMVKTVIIGGSPKELLNRLNH
jgi:glycosyltransferase involved in cell wall biosynthesis